MTFPGVLLALTGLSLFGCILLMLIKAFSQHEPEDERTKINKAYLKAISKQCVVIQSSSGAQRQVQIHAVDTLYKLYQEFLDERS